MRSTTLGISVLTCAAMVAVGARAEVMDRPVGIKIGQRMTLRPYVSVSATYDSNAEGRNDGGDNVYWTVAPGFGLEYKAESWSLIVNLQYQYNAYSKKKLYGAQNYHGISENVTYKWSNAQPGERGWALMLSQTYQKTYEDTATYSGLEYGTDRQTFNIVGAVERRFGEGWHADVNGGYYWLDYDNATSGVGSLYGWDRANIGAEVGYAPSKWLDFLLAGSYMYYSQDNVPNYVNWRGRKPSSESDGVSVQGGFGSYATDHITYRVLAGWSRFDYGRSNGGTSDGFVYTISANWDISATWKTMILATSYYQPTERDYGSSQRVDSLSWGLAHTMVQGKLQGTFDIMYRHETPEFCWSDGTGRVAQSDYWIDSVTFRLGFNYILNRYITLFANAQYRKSTGGGANSARSHVYDYDRIAGTLGLKFTY